MVAFLQPNRQGQYHFPDPEAVDPLGEGLVAVGGDLQPHTILTAYQQGIFPWFNPGDPIMWWCPEPRCLIYPDAFTPSRSLRATARKQGYWLTLNVAFESVIAACAAPRDYANGTWISKYIQAGYTALHHAGYAFSVEVWAQPPASATDTDRPVWLSESQPTELVGGLYGIQLGQAFFGESMFSRRTDVSKLAFWYLMRLCAASGMPWVDCQLPNDHLMRLGATTQSRAEFLAGLPIALDRPRPDWSVLTQQAIPATGLLTDGLFSDLISLDAH